MDASSIIRASVIFIDKRRSRSSVGKGITIRIRTHTTPNAISISLFFVTNGIRIELSGCVTIPIIISPYLFFELLLRKNTVFSLYSIFCLSLYAIDAFADILNK